jgi:3-deoxy-D-manno-octulosonic-acid transferase
MYTFYNLILNLAFLVSFPYLLIRAALGRHGIKERMGRLSMEKTEMLVSKKVIWLHAASVGEVKVLSTIIPQIRREHPEHCLVVSTITKTGRREAERILRDVEQVFFAPVDVKRFVRRTLERINPLALILVETELWPNLIREAKKRGSFVALINGRVSEKSLGRYLLARRLFKQVLSHVDLLCMQSEEHRQRIMLLGANSDRIKVTGNMKFDRLLLVGEADEKQGLKSRMHIPGDCKVLIGGSIREGEEGTLIRVFKQLREHHRDLVFILAPRHLDRLKQVENTLLDLRISFVRKSQLRPPDAESCAEADGAVQDHPVILLDTMGELSKIYSLADVAFVGGSLVPVGGHNLLEPAIRGVPVLFGPYVDHFKEEAKILIESGGGIKVENEEELYLNLSKLLSDDRRRIESGKRAKKAVQRRTGVTRKTTELISSFLQRS